MADLNVALRSGRLNHGTKLVFISKFAVECGGMIKPAISGRCSFPSPFDCFWPHYATALTSNK